MNLNVLSFNKKSSINIPLLKSSFGKRFQLSVNRRFSKKANAIIGYIKIKLEVKIKDERVWFYSVMIRPSKLC